MSFFTSTSASCARCPTCPGEFYAIPGVGPQPSPILILGDRPGVTEEARGRVFIGKVGEELDYTYLPVARLRRNEVRLENVVRCFARGNRPPTEREVLSCGGYFLPEVLLRTKPQVVVLLGGAAHKLIDAVEGVRRPRVDFTHGRPLWGSLLGGVWEGWIWSSYHPALGMRDTAKMTDLLEDFENFGKWWEGDWVPPGAETGISEVRKDYRLVTSSAGVVKYIRDYKELGSSFKVIGADTETHGRDPWSLQVSIADHSGILVRAGDVKTITELRSGVNYLIGEDGWELGFHFANADLEMFEKAGIRTDRYRDTMQEAFHQCSLPQGLKILVYRLLGVTMRSWEDVVWPASVEAVMDWLVEAVGVAEERLWTEEVTEMKTWTCASCGHRAHPLGACRSKAGGRKEVCGCAAEGEWTNEKRERRAGAVEKVLRHVLNHTQRTVDADDPYDPWKALKGTASEPGMMGKGIRGDVPRGEDWRMVEDAVGKMPILGIGNAKMEDAVAYAVSDADHTRLAARVLEERRGDKRWVVHPDDWDQ